MPRRNTETSGCPRRVESVAVSMNCSLPQPGLRVERGGALAHLEVEHGALEGPGLAGVAEHGARGDLRTRRDRDIGEMRVDRVVAVALVVVVREVDATLRHRAHGPAHGDRDVDAVVPHLRTEAWMRLEPHVADDASLYRPVELALAAREVAAVGLRVAALAAGAVRLGLARALEPREQCGGGAGAALQLGGSGLVLLALRLDLLHRVRARFAQVRELGGLLRGHLGVRRDLLQVRLQPLLVRLDLVPLGLDALQEQPVLLRHHLQEVPAHHEPGERLRAHQELEVARGPLHVDVAQAVRQLLALARERRHAALQVRARELQLVVDPLAPGAQRLQAIARRDHLALGALELAERTGLLALQRAFLRALLLRLLAQLLQLAALLGLEAVLLRARDPAAHDERERQQTAGGAGEVHDPIVLRILVSAAPDATHATASAAPTNPSDHIHGRNVSPASRGARAFCSANTSSSAEPAAISVWIIASSTYGVAMKRSLAPSRSMISTCWRRAITVSRSVL